MRVYENGAYRDMTEAEIVLYRTVEEARKREEAAQLIADGYGAAVNALIRRRYNESEEFALLRQREEKAEEFAEYYAYCEECKVMAAAAIADAEKMLMS